MSHCWSQDGSEFSTVCVVVIAVGIFTSLVSIFCIGKIFQMAKNCKFLMAAFHIIIVLNAKIAFFQGYIHFFNKKNIYIIL